MKAVVNSVHFSTKICSFKLVCLWSQPLALSSGAQLGKSVALSVPESSMVEQFVLPRICCPSVFSYPPFYITLPAFEKVIECRKCFKALQIDNCAKSLANSVYIIMDFLIDCCYPYWFCPPPPPTQSPMQHCPLPFASKSPLKVCPRWCST